MVDDCKTLQLSTLLTLFEKYMMNISKYALALSLSGIALSTQAEESSFADLWDYTKLIETEEGNYLNLSGRLHYDMAYFDADQGDYSDALWRRFRFGFKGKYGDFTGSLEADFNFNDGFSDSYNRLTDANVKWQFAEDTSITVLKHSAGFTMDGKTSSKKLLTPQRNNLTNNLWFTDEYFTGVSVKGDLNSGVEYKAGFFSSDDSDEIGFTEASYFTLLSASMPLASSSLWEKGSVSVDYVYNDVHEDGNTRDFSQIVSVSSQFKNGAWGLSSDLSFGKGDMGQSDIWGLVVMPHFQATEKTQWVARYTYMNSDEPNGLRLGRYEKEITEGKGDTYHELYGGVNYFVNGHKLKVQLGAQYTKMLDEGKDVGDYDGFGVTLALRAYW